MVVGAVGNVKPTRYKCPSTDCAWSAFSTLGLCNKCEDVSNRLAWFTIGPSSGSSNHDPPANTTQWVTYHMPTTILGQSLQLDTQLVASHSGMVILVPYVYISASVVGDNNSSSTGGTVLALIQSLRLSPAYVTHNISLWDHIPVTIQPHALECSIVLCQQVHENSRLLGLILHDHTTWSRDVFLPGWSNETLHDQNTMLLGRPAGLFPMLEESRELFSYNNLNDTYQTGWNDLHELMLCLAEHLGDLHVFELGVRAQSYASKRNMWTQT